MSSIEEEEYPIIVQGVSILPVPKSILSTPGEEVAKCDEIRNEGKSLVAPEKIDNVDNIALQLMGGGGDEEMVKISKTTQEQQVVHNETLAHSPSAVFKEFTTLKPATPFNPDSKWPKKVSSLEFYDEERKLKNQWVIPEDEDLKKDLDKVDYFKTMFEETMRDSDFRATLVSSSNEEANNMMTTSTSITTSTSSTTTTSFVKQNEEHNQQQRQYRCCRITKIQIQSGAIVDGITITYLTSSGYKEHVCGGVGFSGSFLSIPENEYVVKVEVEHNPKYVTCISFLTNLGRKIGPCGGGGALFLGGKTCQKSSVVAPEGCMLVGIHGRHDKYLDAIGFYWASVLSSSNNNIASIQKSRTYGGPGGKIFDHGHYYSGNHKKTTAKQQQQKKSLLKQMGLVFGIGLGSIRLLYDQRLFSLGDNLNGTVKLKLSDPTVKTTSLVVNLNAFKTHYRTERNPNTGEVHKTETVENIFSYQQVLHEEKTYTKQNNDDDYVSIPFTVQFPRTIQHREPNSILETAVQVAKVIRDINRNISTGATTWKISAKLSIPWTTGLHVEKQLYVDDGNW